MFWEVVSLFAGIFLCVSGFSLPLFWLRLVGGWFLRGQATDTPFTFVMHPRLCFKHANSGKEGWKERKHFCDACLPPQAQNTSVVAFLSCKTNGLVSVPRLGEGGKNAVGLVVALQSQIWTLALRLCSCLRRSSVKWGFSCSVSYFTGVIM